MKAIFSDALLCAVLIRSVATCMAEPEVFRQDDEIQLDLVLNLL